MPVYAFVEPVASLDGVVLQSLSTFHDATFFSFLCAGRER
jgi:hypothetical protein